MVDGELHDVRSGRSERHRLRPGGEGERQEHAPAWASSGRPYSGCVRDGQRCRVGGEGSWLVPFVARCCVQDEIQLAVD